MSHKEAQGVIFLDISFLMIDSIPLELYTEYKDRMDMLRFSGFIRRQLHICRGGICGQHSVRWPWRVASGFEMCYVWEVSGGQSIFMRRRV